MSELSPYNLTIGEDGLSVRCEWDAHYLTDEQLETVREHVETIERMNVLLREENGRLQIESGKLRELVRDIADHIKHDDGFGIDRGWVLDRMRELGVEV